MMRPNGSRETSPKERHNSNSKSGRIQATAAGTSAGWGRGTTSPGRRSHFAFQAKTFMSGILKNIDTPKTCLKIGLKFCIEFSELKNNSYTFS